MARQPNLYQKEQPQSVDDLRVSSSYIVPKSLDMAAAAHCQRPLACQAFRSHLTELAQHLDLAAGPDAIDEAWGLRAQTGHRCGSTTWTTASSHECLNQIQVRLTDLVIAAPVRTDGCRATGEALAGRGRAGTFAPAGSFDAQRPQVARHPSGTGAPRLVGSLCPCRATDAGALGDPAARLGA